MNIVTKGIWTGIRFIRDKSKDSTLSDLLIPNCKKCGQPMSFDEEEQRWYCFTDNLPFINNQLAGKSSRKPKRDWRRILVAALFCAIPCCNPAFFLSAYDRSRLKGSNCPHCERTGTEVNRTLRLRNNRFDTILEYHCLGCGAEWQRREKREQLRRTSTASKVRSWGEVEIRQNR